MSVVLAGRYRLDNVIGTGGMGTVWRGYDEMLYRPVAVKELHLPAQLSDAARAEAVGRAITEARYAARLQHPNIVAVYDIVEHDSRPWIVMQLVEGVSLYRYVQQYGPRPPAEAARIGLAMVDALSAAHAAGVVHRDVKPSNVLLGPRGEVLLTDFSIAFAVGSVTMTSTGVVLGSPGYVAPERVSGGRTGPAADLFGLGATLFFLVEGYGPFDNEDPLAGLLASATQPHPRFRNAGPLTPVIDGLLTKDPDQRMTAQAAHHTLTAIVNQAAGGPVAPPAAPGHAVGGASSPTEARRRLPGRGPAPYPGPPAPPRPVGSPTRPDGPPRPPVPTPPDRSDDSNRARWYGLVGVVVGLIIVLLLGGGGVLLALRPKIGPDGTQQLGDRTRTEASTFASPTASAVTTTPDPTGSTATSPAPTTVASQPASGAPGGGQPAGGNQPPGGNQPGVDNPPVIESVSVPSTVCSGQRFTLTVVAYDDRGVTSAGFEYTIVYPDSTGDRWGGGLTPGPNNTWTAQVGRPADDGPFNRPGSTIQGYVSFYDGVNVPPTTRSFPLIVNIIQC